MSIKTKPKAPASKQVKASPNRQQQLVRLLDRKSGASIAQMQEAFGWQPHTARAAISTLRKAGFAVDRADTEKGAVYRVVEET